MSYTDLHKRPLLSIARIQYKKRAVIRDERMKRLEEIKTLKEKLKILQDDPDAPKVRLVSHASIPLEPDPPK